MSKDRLANYVKMCMTFGVVKGDSFKTYHVMTQASGIYWVEKYANSDIGTWFNYPALGIQIRLS
jgi:hypothetical protein